ncbi:MAG: MFS transporter [Rhizobiaceae bacterium]
MFAPLKQPDFRRLFSAQLVSLFGTGLMTVALALLAYRLAGEDAGAVLGTALAIKMVAYVTVSPIANAIAAQFANKSVLVGLDLFRAGIALFLPFVSEIWQIYLLVFLLQAASAAFTPVFQAVIPDILTDEDEYTQALSLSRLAYDLESLASPVIAAALLTFVSFHWLFAATAVGFVVSASFLAAGPIPDRLNGKDKPFRERLTAGMNQFSRLSELKGLMALNLVVSATGAMVIVNTVVIIQTGYGAGETGVAIAYAFFGAGSMLAALILPKLLPLSGNRTVMVAGASIMTVSLVAAAIVLHQQAPLATLLVIWSVAGLGYSAVLTPVGRLLTALSPPEKRPALFAAQFALSHACWLITYPLAGWGGAMTGMVAIASVLAAIAFSGTLICLWLWPAGSDETFRPGADP